ncbi:oxidoreductase [Tritonibacter mobilis]|uniref:oxidoreductase n=1 Tax=Tritonibacter mobilis TaxID=379347 RepID=UPI003A5BE69B
MTTSKHKVIVVTGASSGIGKTGALRLISEGYTVYGAARSVDKMQDLVVAGGHVLPLDVTDASSVKQAVAQVLKEQGRIDVLWNNAGYSVAGAVEDVPLLDARQQFEVNLFGVAEITKTVLPQMRKQRSGLIINTSSVGGKVFSPLNAWYHASKFALEGWSDALRLELAAFNIDVVVLEPGGIKTDFGRTMYEPLLKRAEGGAYEAFTQRIAASYERYYTANDSTLSPPSVVGEAVAQIVQSTRPPTRYAVGYMARTALALRWLLSDRLFSRMIMTQF